MTRHAAANLSITRALLGLVIAAAGASLTAAAQARDHDPGWSAPPEASAKINPLLNRRGAAAGGAKLFQQRCSTCHGEDGRGTAHAPDLDGRDVRAQTDGQLYWKIRSGNTRAGMPAFSFLPEPQRWQLVLHLRGLASKRE